MNRASADISVLCVDDEPGMADLVATYLERFDDHISVDTATSAREAYDRLDDVDCVVSDYDMPDVDGLMFLESVRADHPGLPFVLFTGRGSEEIAADAITAGVTDYMQKESGSDQYRVLAQRIRNAVARYRLDEESDTTTERAETILEASPDPIVVTEDGRVTYANPAAIDLLAAGPDADVLGRSLDDLFRSPPTLRSDPDAVERLVVTVGDHAVPVDATARGVEWDGTEGVVRVLREAVTRPATDGANPYRASLLDSLLETSPDGILVTTDDWAITAYNERFSDIWGVPESVLDAVDGEDAFDAVLDVAADPAHFRTVVEAQYEHPDSSHHHRLQLQDGTVLDQHSAPVYTDDGGRYGFVWFYRDVTDLTAIERAQREAFDRMTDAVYALDDDWAFTFVNDHAETLLQRDAADLLGTSLWEAFPEAEETILRDEFVHAVESNESVSFELDYPPLDGTFEVRAFPSETGLTVYFRDVTDERRTAAELRESVDALRRLYEVTSDRDRSFDAKLQAVLDIGAEYLSLPFGFVSELSETTQYIAASTGDHPLLQPGESCPLGESYCRKTVETDEGLLAIEHAGDDGWADDPAYDAFDLETYIGGRVTVDGDLYGTVCFASDTARGREFTEMERTFVELLTRWLSYELEQREYRADLEQKNTQLEEFASIVSHDLRNPLTVASGHLDLAREERESEHLERVADAHERMERLIEDILTLARDGDVVDELRPAEVGGVAESAWQTVDTADATLDATASRDVLADSSRLTQLFENLYRNAIEHGGPSVTVTVRDIEGGFAVADDGPGFADVDTDRLFEAGYTTSEDGTGLGLRIVSRIAEAHGWTVEAMESEAGGARFEFTSVERP
ncbi:PAS domain-containing protein [Salarchaeum japonicum]|uniref:histidine kinase n=1 Tax=Salarchaeum japonicum TaxID=555573 RepID=A0AAV3T2W9_9EURY|nr:PAS domain-containing protein [Salarchaeum japonicum]